MNDAFAVKVLSEMRETRRGTINALIKHFANSGLRETHLRQFRREVAALSAAINRLAGK